VNSPRLKCGILNRVRIPLDIPDHIHRRLKSRAALLRCSVCELILRGVENELKCQSQARTEEKNNPATHQAKRPGWLRLSNRVINEIIVP